ncbi:MAG: ATP-binding protein [Rickettsiales bacterium]|nr:ATP-binding protein [Rickettsiales bacterium]
MTALLPEDDQASLRTYEKPALHATHDITPSASLMAAMLAHEIKNPLSGIRGAAQLLAQNVSKDDQALTELICREVDRISGLLKKIEFFSNQPVPCDQAVNIHEVLMDVCELTQSQRDTKISFATQYDPSLPEVRGDRALLTQLFMNLVQNAIEACLSEGVVPDIKLGTHYQINHTFRMHKSEGELRALPIAITVEDNGGGLDPAIVDAMFDPFVTTKTSGTGLGLAIVAKIVGEHGGMISLEPPDAGTTRFKVMLPAFRG